MSTQAVFCVGQLVTHSLFKYRGVVIDVDPTFMLSDDWYELMAKSRPPKDKPWYRVLVHSEAHETYVAERNLQPCDDRAPINHPGIDNYFTGFENGKYIIDKNHAN